MSANATSAASAAASAAAASAAAQAAALVNGTLAVTPGSLLGEPVPNLLTSKDKALVGVMVAAVCVCFILGCVFGPYCLGRRALEKRGKLPIFDKEDHDADEKWTQMFAEMRVARMAAARQAVLDRAASAKAKVPSTDL